MKVELISELRELENWEWIKNKLKIGVNLRSSAVNDHLVVFIRVHSLLRLFEKTKPILKWTNRRKFL